MSKKVVLIALGAIVGILLIVGASLALYVAGIYNDSVSREKHILAVDEQNKNNMSNFTMRVKEMAQIPDMQVSGLKELVEATMNGRYKEGSGKLMQWITEQNPALDQSTYKQLMNTMETGRRDFEAEQKKKIDACREYSTLLDKFPRGPVTRMFGFPKINIDPNSTDETAPCRIIVAGEVKQKFATGTDDVIKVK